MLSTIQGGALCCCVASRNKPCCDGSHWQAGFRDEKN
ncbi:MAG: CDGSH iron-sulfur domain-containing protein [Burkholderiales bacterium]